VPKLYIEVEMSRGEESARAVIAGTQSSVVLLERNGRVLRGGEVVADADAVDADVVELSLRKVYDFAMNTPLEELEFIMEAERLNMAAAETSFGGNYGHGLGVMLRGGSQSNVLGDTLFSRILAYTSAACDARMSGAPVPVMSNSGSGNQGIASTVPVVVYGRECRATHEQMVRALALSHLTVIYIKQGLGRLSALCGCVVAATGSSCGITYLMGGGYDEISIAVKNMVANLTGMICDGAKPSCSLKLSSGVSTAVLSAMMAMEHRCTTSTEGIVDDDVDKTIRNLTDIGRDAMDETDRMILDIMTGKC
jgi:L-cysteine desulfidase